MSDFNLDTEECCEFPDIEVCDVVSTLPVQYQQSQKLHDLFIKPLVKQLNCIRDSYEVMCGQSDCSELSGDALTHYGESVGFGREHCNACCNIDGFASVDDDDLYCRLINLHVASKHGVTTSNLCSSLDCFFNGDAKILTSSAGVTEIGICRELTEIERKFLPLIERTIPHTCGTQVRLYANDPSTNFDVNNIFGINCAGCDTWNGELCSDAAFLCSQVICDDPPMLSCFDEFTITVGMSTTLQLGNDGGQVPAGGWSISPDLPDGLQVEDGYLFGTALAVFPDTVFTVTATGPNGSDTCEITLMSREPIPIVTCSPDRTFRVGSGEAVIVANATGVGNSAGPITWSIFPALPAGLMFNPSTAEITGAPTVALPSTQFTITATNSSGSDSCTFNLTVVSEELPCDGIIECIGEQEVINNFTTILTGVGIIPNTLTTFGSCTGNISGVEIVRSYFVSGGTLIIGLDTPIPSNWTELVFSGSGQTQILDISGMSGIRDISTTVSTNAYQSIFNGPFTVEANCN